VAARPAEAEEFRESLQMFQRALRDIFESSKQDAAARKLFEDAIKPARIARFMELVRGRSTEPGAVDALAWIGRVSPWPPTAPSTIQGEEARSILARDHILSPRIGNALPGAMSVAAGSEAAERLYREALARSPHRDVRGRSCFWLAKYLSEQAGWAREIRMDVENQQRAPDAPDPRLLASKRWGKDAMKRLAQKSPDLLAKEAESLFDRALTEFADVSAYGTSADPRSIGELATYELRRIREFGVGQLATEIEGSDINGKHFKLSDYRGRVVVLTFSGNWCGPCRAMYPQERTMVDRLKDKSFVLLSVNTDQEKETLRKSISAGEIKWRCWCDGGTTGPITTKWLVDSFPAVYVLDHKGVIRFKGLRRKQLDDAVDKLLEEVTASKKGK